METQTWGPPSVTTSARPSMPNCASAGAAGLDHDVGPSDQCPEDAGAMAALQVEADGSLPPVQEVEECAGAAARAVGSLRRLDLHHGGARPGQEIAAQRPRPEGGEVDHDQARHVGSWRRVAESLARGLRRVHPILRPPRRGRPGSPSSRARSIKTCGSRSARCAATVDHTAGVDAGTVSSSSQAGTISMSSSRGSDTAKKPSAQRSSRQLPPQLVAPRRHNPIDAARSPRSASASSPGNGRASRSIPSTRPSGGPSGSSGHPVSAMAPLFAQRSTRGSSTSAG